MPNELLIRIPLEIPEAQWPEYLATHWELFREAMDLSGDYFDRRSQVDRVHITSIEILQAQIVITYEVNYSGFHPCKDLHYSETAIRSLAGQRKQNLLTFAKPLSLERLSTCDEF